jgi:hypothetical protein
MSDGTEFDSDLAEVSRIRAEHSSDAIYTTQWRQDVGTLLAFIDNLWKAYTVEGNKQDALRSALTAAGQQWNRIEDSTPEIGRTILMWSYYSYQMHMGYYDRGLWIGPNGSLGGITHWMLPPEVPK